MIDKDALIAAGFAAAHRRVEHVAATLFGFGGELTRDDRRDARHVDQQRARLHASENSLIAGVHEFHVRRIGQHGDDDFTARRDSLRTRCHLRTFFIRFVYRRAAAIVNDN